MTKKELIQCLSHLLDEEEVTFCRSEAIKPEEMDIYEDYLLEVFLIHGNTIYLD